MHGPPRPENATGLAEAARSHGRSGLPGSGRSITNRDSRREVRNNATWRAALRSDGEAQACAVAELERRLRGVVRRVVDGRRGASDVADLVQESLTRIIEGLDSFRGDSAFTTWATGIAIRTALTDERRRRCRQGERDLFATARDEARATFAATDDPGDALGREELLAALHRAVRECLTERQRIAILAELRGVPTIEIAERLGTNQNALYKLIHDARRKLRDALLAAGFTARAIREQVEEPSR